MIFYFLLNDSRCCQIEFSDINSALHVASEKFEYDDYFEFLDDLNIVEWKDGKNRIILDYSNNKKTLFPIDTPYQLESFLKIVKTRKPKRQLEEEFDDIDL